MVCIHDLKIWQIEVKDHSKYAYVFHVIYFLQREKSNRVKDAVGCQRYFLRKFLMTHCESTFKFPFESLPIQFTNLTEVTQSGNSEGEVIESRLWKINQGDQSLQSDQAFECIAWCPDRCRPSMWRDVDKERACSQCNECQSRKRMARQTPRGRKVNWFGDLL